ncbi:MAG: DUF2177 family protein [Alphaproteobacteria bacterium]|nr:DUF2177 family protein [Alphaproteobacteria bacterium]
MLKSYATASLVAFFFFLVVDIIWLSQATRFIYRPQIGPLLLDKPVVLAAVAFYFLFGVGLSVLVVRPALDATSIFAALWMGALFGLVTYGTYDLTNSATLKGWSLTVTVVDMCWGAVLAGCSAAVGVWIALRFV